MSVMVKGANLLDSFIVGWHMLVRSLLLQARTFISPTWKHKFLHVVCLTCLLPSSLQRADVCTQRLRRLFCCGLNCLLSRATPPHSRTTAARLGAAALAAHATDSRSQLWVLASNMVDG